LFSDETEIYACQSPTMFKTPQVLSISSTAIQISWLEPQDNGGCSITSFEIWRDDSNGGAFVSVHPEMNNLPSLNVFSITDLPASSIGKTLRIQLKAKNQGGYSISSPIVSVVISDVPNTPAAGPAEIVAKTSGSFIAVSYSAPSNGGSVITQYEVQIDDGLNGGSFYTIQLTLNLYAYVSTGIVQGRNYQLRYRARNVNGWSQYSPITFILSAAKPIAPPRLTYVSSTSTSVTLYVSPSLNDNGAPITKHTLYRDQGNLTDPISVVTDFTSPLSAQSYQVTGLTTGLVY
jgi:hypothetical protein